MSLHIASYTRNIDRCYPLTQKLWVGGQQISVNDGQKKSIEMALENEFQLIQGPPGNMQYYVCTYKISTYNINRAEAIVVF